jgi:hypothetical protein
MIKSPASMTGWLILKRHVRGVENTGCDEGMMGMKYKDENLSNVPAYLR